MKSKYKIIIALLLINFSACSQVQNKQSCADRIDQLYAQQKLHLIFCSYYFEEATPFSGAATILDNLSFYRDTINAAVIAKKGSTIIDNLKKEICTKDTGLITEMKKWCETSRKIAEMRSEVDFTIEGYMEFLNEFKKMKSIITPFLTKDRTIYSLSTYEMEEIYFASIGVINSLGKEDQNNLFKKLQSWDFK
ncbi:MAG: hypothetical protein JST86_01910 [Bacteroidetes bacterium]|nr:hypothetical protein [Bacteroidota bacterium]